VLVLRHRRGALRDRAPAASEPRRQGRGQRRSSLRPCNSLKGSCTVEEFRQALAVRLGRVVVFAAEATEDQPATEFRSVRSLGADREVVRIDPLTGDRLSRAVLFLRSAGGLPTMTAKAAATEAIDAWLDRLSSARLGGADFPADGGVPNLFDEAEQVEQRPILRPGELSSTPRVTMPRDVTRISGPVLEQVRKAVEILRQREAPGLSYMAFVDAAVMRLVRDVEARYPELAEPGEESAKQA
jgi:hypothetical protein